ncbi:MAG: heparinase II/III family protein [Clostridia bacterium]|nr:heparinase II/III family protein [Clostridia bacterium]
MELLGKAMDPAFWQGVREKDCYKLFRDDLQERWEKFCTQPLKALKYSEFKMFKFTGNRSVYEDEYCYRRKSAVASALLALIYPEEEKYIVRLMDSLYALCDDYTWCPPAHNTALEVNNNVHIDIFASETGAMVAEIYTLLGERLEPLIRDRIRTELLRRIIIPWENKKYGWEKNPANWNTVCTGGIAVVTMLMFPERMEGYMPRITENIECYLSGFKDDGICEEGVSYWHYGFGNFVFFADIMRKFTEGKVDYFTRPKVREVAAFMQKMYISGRCTVSFSDAQVANKYHIGLLHYLKNEYPDLITVSGLENSYITDGRGRWNFNFRAILWMDERYLTPDTDVKNATYFAPYSQWLVHKEPKYGFAIKGGHNNEPHNHNDVGSFIIARDGHQIITDLGAGKYTRQYFAPSTRYDHLHCSSRGHSLPIIDGKYQCFGAQFAAKNTKYESGVFSTDIAGAYGVDELKSLVRTVRCEEDAVILRDNYDYDGNGELIDRLATFVKPVVKTDGQIRLGSIDVLFDPEICELSLGSEPRNETADLYFIDLKLKNSVKAIEVTFKML